MTNQEKTAIARIFSDLIKADRIVDTGEMEYWRNICVKYEIDRTIRVAARNMTFADAVETVGRSGLGPDLLGDCRAMTLSDGFCAHSEALIMIALMTMFTAESPFHAEVYSIPRASFDIDIATAIYVESCFDEPANAAIRAHYRSIFKEFQLVGFHFIYIPNIIDHYRNTDPALFRDILAFLAPLLSESGIEKAYDSLMDMTTASYSKDLLCNKCGFSQLRDTLPSILIKIGNSFVGENRYANYLRIEVDEHMLRNVQDFIDLFSGMLSGDIFVVNTSEEHGDQFHFHGFYKQLLDIFLVRRNIRSSVVVDPYHEEIRFPDIDAVASGMHRREKALYALLLCQGSGGINFDPPRSAGEFKRFETHMRRIQSRYEAIYELFGGCRDGAPDLSKPEIRRPIIACIRRSIARLDALYNRDDYTVTRSSSGSFAVHIEPDLVYATESPLKEKDAGTLSPTVALHSSGLYKKWKNA